MYRGFQERSKRENVISYVRSTKLKYLSFLPLPSPPLLHSSLYCCLRLIHFQRESWKIYITNILFSSSLLAFFFNSLVRISVVISSSSIPFFHKILSSEFNTATESHGNLVVVFRVCYSSPFGNCCTVFLFAGLTGAEVLSWIFTAAISLNSPDPLGVHSVFPLCVGIFSWQEGKELVGDIPFFFRGLMKLYCGSLTGWT